MSEQNSLNAKLEESIKEIFIGDTLKNVLEFVQHLGMLGMAHKGSLNDGKFVYKDKNVCYTYFGNSSNSPGYPEPWTVWMSGGFGTENECVPFDDRMKEIVWGNVHKCDENCPHINKGCSKQRVLFGQSFDKLCQTPIGFTDPNAEETECMKRLMEMLKRSIDK